MKIEMHCHTDHSDGILSVSALLDRAVEAGITHIAISDHDNVDAYPEALEIAPDGLAVLPAVELSTTMDGRDVHMLGYFLDMGYEPLLDEMERCRSSRANRTKAIIERLEADGYPISVGCFEEKGLALNRSNIARVLFEQGATSYVDEAFDTLIGRGKPYFEPRKDIDSLLALRLLLEAGGVPVIAHPAHYGVVDLIEPLHEQGLMGIECYHSEQSPAESEMLEAMARELGMIVTGGSDYHGDAMHPSVLGGNQPSEADIDVFLALGRERGFSYGR